MENIVEPNESFDFSKLSLAHPSGIQGGAYFTKIEYNKKQLYIQTVKSLTRQGIVKTGKKFYCDLMFDKNSETLIQWFEKLEEKCQKLLYEKKESWFQNSLEESDIESAFNSTIRIYKSGKYYLVRTNIRNSQTNEPSVKIYNENQVSLRVDDITNETEIVSILEIQGIKFTSRNFQIEIELKQIMILDKQPIFDTCLIKSFKTTNINNNALPLINSSEPLEQSLEQPLEQNLEQSLKQTLEKTLEKTFEQNLDNNIVNINELQFDTNEVNHLDNLENKNLNHSETINNNDLSITDNKLVDKNDNSLNFEIEDLNNDVVEENAKELEELELNINLDNLEPLTLKKPNQVYFDLYKEARNKAKLAKKNAILAYLAVKNIKKTFMLDNLNDSDSDFDNEIDEVSESELEGL